MLAIPFHIWRLGGEWGCAGSPGEAWPVHAPMPPCTLSNDVFFALVVRSGIVGVMVVDASRLQKMRVVLEWQRKFQCTPVEALGMVW